jgi:hypothetical protein
MDLIDISSIIVFTALLIFAVYLIYNFYICDNETCGAFIRAGNQGPRDSKVYALTILNNIYSDGIWPFGFICGLIISFLALWFINVKITVRTYAIVFIVSFFTTYFILSFLGHHYIRFLTAYVETYIEDYCGGVPNPTNNRDNVDDADGVNTVSFFEEEDGDVNGNMSESELSLNIGNSSDSVCFTD